MFLPSVPSWVIISKQWQDPWLADAGKNLVPWHTYSNANSTISQGPLTNNMIVRTTSATGFSAGASWYCWFDAENRCIMPKSKPKHLYFRRFKPFGVVSLKSDLIISINRGNSAGLKSRNNACNRVARSHENRGNCSYLFSKDSQIQNDFCVPWTCDRMMIVWDWHSWIKWIIITVNVSFCLWYNRDHLMKHSLCKHLTYDATCYNFSSRNS